MASTSIDKALEVCEALSRAPRGASVGELARTLGLPAPTVHRLLGGAEAARLRAAGRGDAALRPDAQDARLELPVPGPLRVAAARVPGAARVRAGFGPAGVHRDSGGRRGHLRVGRPAPTKWRCGPCTARRCRRTARCIFRRRRRRGVWAACGSTAPRDVARRRRRATARSGRRPWTGAAPPLGCTCAPVVDYTGREVARLGIFGHAADETPLVTTMNRDGWELARQVSRRLGWLPPASVDIPA